MAPPNQQNKYYAAVIEDMGRVFYVIMPYYAVINLFETGSWTTLTIYTIVIPCYLTAFGQVRRPTKFLDCKNKAVVRYEHNNKN